MIPGLEQVDFWHWWILAGLLLILELSRPTFIFLWVGIAAVAVGFLMLVFPAAPPEAQLILFGALTLVAVLIRRRYRESHPRDPD